MSDMADRPDRADKIVDSLTHLVRGVNCTVLAIYADRTATVEIQVMRMWKENGNSLMTTSSVGRSKRASF
jgi:hypothetical protein